MTRDGIIHTWSNSDATKTEQLCVGQSGWFSSEKAVQISANEDNIACVTKSGKVLVMGRGGLGQLGNGKVNQEHRLSCDPADEICTGE